MTDNESLDQIKKDCKSVCFSVLLIFIELNPVILNAVKNLIICHEELKINSKII